MSSLEVLLEVQERDTAADRLRHRRTTLPERAELASVEGRIGALDARLVQARGRREAAGARQDRLEAEVQALDQRIREIERRLYSGTVSASRELQAMAGEVDALKARRSSIEDEGLAALEEAEPLVAEVASLEAERQALVEETDRLKAAIAEAEAAIDAEVAVELEARNGKAAALSGELLETYERLRKELGGVGAARLVGNSCSGCHLVLPMSELARLRREPADVVVLCDQCGRILVR